MGMCLVRHLRTMTSLVQGTWTRVYRRSGFEPAIGTLSWLHPDASAQMVISV